MCGYRHVVIHLLYTYRALTEAVGNAEGKLFAISVSCSPNSDENHEMVINGNICLIFVWCMVHITA